MDPRILSWVCAATQREQNAKGAFNCQTVSLTTAPCAKLLFKEGGFEAVRLTHPCTSVRLFSFQGQASHSWIPYPPQW